MRRRLILTALALALAPAGALAGAPPHVVVPYADLDLDRAEDAVRLVRRIEAAALQACGADAKSLEPVRRAVRRSPCWSEAVAEAVAALAHPQVTAAHAAETERLKAGLTKLTR